MKKTTSERLTELSDSLKAKTEAAKQKKVAAKTGYADMKTATQKVDFIGKHLGLEDGE
ncbi:MAG: hypothetical protein JW811_00745 [Clostridiales bacterium]|nr:hypothetical protein [Clostridiales bacterium]